MQPSKNSGDEPGRANVTSEHVPAVLAEGLKKRFGKTEALCGVDFDVQRGTVLGVLGPNGAGKTTSVRILTTLIKPDAGRAMIDGIDVVAEPRRARARIGLTGQYAAVDERLTGGENLEHVGRLFHLPAFEAKRRANELLERFNLEGAGNRTVKGYSGGMRRRLDIAMSLIARPSVLFLDEPTTGLDPRSRNAMWELIDELVREGTSTLLTTQYLEEAERLADDIVVIDRGRVIARGTSDQLKAHAGGERVEVRVSDPAELERVAPLLREALQVSGAERIDPDLRTVTLPVREGDGIVPLVVRVLDQAGIGVLDVVVQRPTLDDVFLQLTGHVAEASDEEATTATDAPTTASATDTRGSD
jgi:ABC-2 type transport system ATP-binding protein